MTPQDIITTARYLLNDTNSDGYRQSNTELLLYVNDGMREISKLRPDLFLIVADHTCAISTVEQTLAFSTAQALVRVVSISGGAALTPFDMDTMDAFNPSWRTDTAAAATQWSKHPGDPLRFFVYPSAPATSQVLDVLYVKNPTSLAIGDSITEVPLLVQPALVDYVVSRASEKDDEHSASGRVAASYAAFAAKVGGGQ